MAIMTLTLPNPINISLQAKSSTIITTSIDNGAWDIIYFTRLELGKQVGDIYRLGKCIAISQGPASYTISVDVDSEAQTPDTGDYIFFGKENKVNLSGVRGYYAEVEMKNDSNAAAKLFAVGSEIAKSSK
tara:strand:+ start:6036 stop:6425 length:390 start_codon:yes stop_codon:yes gene_type:complete